MTQATKEPAFNSLPVATIIIALPILVAILKFVLWDTYGVFDFHTFHLAGTLANQGLFEQIYQSNTFVSYFDAAYGDSQHLPWFYPPFLLPYCQFLAIFPVSIAFLIHSTLNIGIFYVSVFWAFRANTREILVLSSVPAAISLGFGHPTLLLLAALIAGYKISKSHPALTLIPLTFAAAKPHLGGVVLFLYFAKNFPKSILPSLLIGAVTLGLFALIYDLHIWEYTFKQLLTAGQYLQGTNFNPDWLSSAHGLTQRMGLPIPIVWLLHFSTLLVICAIAFARFPNNPDRFWLVAGLAAFFLSPYVMLYDTPFLIFPLILVLIHTNPAERRNWTYLVFTLQILMLFLLNMPEITTININFLVILAIVVVLLKGANLQKNHQP